jgi:shikimate dehydrogenase
MPIDAKTRLVTLLGFPVEHSMSPRLHNTAFAAQGVNARYVATPVRPAHLADALAGLRALRFLGANVTIPHKEAVLPLLDDLTPTAEAVGAVNTLVTYDQDAETLGLRGDNTDVSGFLDPLASHRPALEGTEATVLGAGGAARAVVFGLLDRTPLHRLTIAARRPEQAERLAESFADVAAATTVAATNLTDAPVAASRLVVNATPVGMHPDVDRTPWTAAGDFSADQIVYDLVYNPRETRLLREAAARGATPIGGLDMLIGQAAAAYEQWTGRAMPTKTVRDEIFRAKGERM